MDRNERDIADAAMTVERELRRIRNRQLDRSERQRAARMIQNLAVVMSGALDDVPVALSTVE
jgi:hypothetical protein